MKRSKSSLFLMEQIIVIAVFSVCAAACVKILTASYYTAKDTRDMGNAILAAENAAECYKARQGDFGKVAAILGGSVENSGSSASVVVYFNKEWRVCEQKDAAYVMRIIENLPARGAGTMASGKLTVDRTYESETTLVSFPVAVVAAS